MISATLGAASWAAAGVASAARPPARATAAVLARVVKLLISSFQRLQRPAFFLVPLNSLRQGDGHLATATDGRGQEGIAKRFLRTRLARSISVLELFRAELCNMGRKLGIVVAELVELATVVTVDLGLHRVGAG